MNGCVVLNCAFVRCRLSSIASLESMERLDFRKPFSALPKLKKVSMAKESMCLEGSEGFLQTNNKNSTTFRSSRR